MPLCLLNFCPNAVLLTSHVLGITLKVFFDLLSTHNRNPLFIFISYPSYTVVMTLFGRTLGPSFFLIPGWKAMA